MNIRHLETLSLFKVDQLESYHRNGYNLISCGASRGGTSALGVLMSYFGFDLGANTHPTTYEDIDFSLATELEEFYKFPELMRKRAESSPNWALKLPHAMKYMHVFDEHCQRAVFFIVIRNPLSVARSLVRHDSEYPDMLASYVRGIEHSFDFYKKLETLQYLKAPFILCEYEKIQKNPRQFVKDFLVAVGKTATPEQEEAATRLVSGSGYRSVDHVKDADS